MVVYIRGPQLLAMAHYWAAACLKPDCGRDGQAHAREAPLTWVEGACAQARSSIWMNGASCISTHLLCKWSSACNCKCPPLSWVESFVLESKHSPLARKAPFVWAEGACCSHKCSCAYVHTPATNTLPLCWARLLRRKGWGTYIVLHLPKPQYSSYRETWMDEGIKTEYEQGSRERIRSKTL